MDIRMEVVSATLAAAEHREAVAMESKTQLDESYKKGLLPALTRTAAAEQAYHGQKDAEALRAEKRALTDQIKMLTIATEQADLALSDLLDLFDQGRLHAPIAGTVNAVLANRGAVVRAVGVGWRTPVCCRLGSRRAMVQFGGWSKSLDRCRGRRIPWNNCKDRHSGVGLAARISKSLYTDRAPPIGLDRIRARRHAPSVLY
jgi:hypothetical protein